jgi:hypothetical protein
MRRITIALLGLALAAAVPPAARGDSLSIPLPTPFVVLSGQTNAVNFAVGGQPAAANVLGYSLSGNWTPGPNAAWSSELRMAVTPPGGPRTTYAYVGGNDNETPFAFPGPNSTGNLFSNLTGPLPSYTAGSYTASFYTTFGGTTANLAGATLNVHYNPTTDTGTTAAGPTFNRPEFDETLSTNATAVRYSVTRFTVGQSGVYMVVQTTPGHDGYLVVYRDAFDPLHPLANFVGTGDNDVGEVSVLVNQLNAGTDYYFVSTGYQNADFGAYTSFIAGPGLVVFSPVPEPATGLLVGGLALAAGGWLRRRRRRSSTGMVSSVGVG